MWSENDLPKLIPPSIRRLPGNPKKNRKRETDEARPQKRSKCVHCTVCGRLGHNRRSCTQRFVGNGARSIATSIEGAKPNQPAKNIQQPE